MRGERRLIRKIDQGGGQSAQFYDLVQAEYAEIRLNVSTCQTVNHRVYRSIFNGRTSLSVRRDFHYNPT